MVDVINYFDECSDLMVSESPVWIEDTEFFKDNDAVVARGHRVRKLTLQQRHEKHAHIGYSPNCTICSVVAHERHG